jgi:NADH-quinone oxidoreductase subunit G
MTKQQEMINFEIDGKPVQGTKDETILQVARRNGIYIPTMCYLTKVKPIASCRMCVVDIEGMDAPILSCQERAVEGLKVITQSPELYKQRQNIMKLYDVNHPLQCGVCPKSGECDLQNKTLEFNVGNQDFAAVEQNRELQEWGNITYDPYLCIMCERCVRVSNEIVGDGALQIAPGGYNSKIINTKLDDINVDWGECAAVCPVGALSDLDFKYNTNAWELKRIPAACAHSSLANMIYYEIKNERIYRVRNEFEFDSMAGVCRYGYDYANEGSNNDADMDSVVEAFKKADTIRFTSIITNEEALILQKLKEKYSYKLINAEAKNYQNFLKAFSSTSGASLYQGDADKIKSSDCIVILGSKIADDIPGLKFKVNQASKRQRAQVIYMHPIEDLSIKNIVTQHVKYEAGSEESLLAMVAEAILKESDLPEAFKKFFADIDEGYISAESNVGEEEITSMMKRMKNKNNLSFIVGSDLYAHPQAENIAKILGLIEKYSDFKVTIIPPLVNTLGVALICDLDEEEGSKSIGYNTTGDFILSALKDAGDVNMPAINQQEGTFTTLNKRVVPTNVALSFDGFCLNDIANKLGLDVRYTVDYTSMLPKETGYQSYEFDALDNYFSQAGEEVRGYALESQEIKADTSLSELSELESFDGVVVYGCNPNSQKNVFTNICKYLKTDAVLLGSAQFAVAAKAKDGDTVSIMIDGKKIERVLKVSDEIKGTIALMPIFDLGFEGQSLMSKYRFNKVKLTQVNK